VRLSLPYGHGAQLVELPRENLLRLPGGAQRVVGLPPGGSEERAEIARALREPLGAPPLATLAARACSAAVVVSDVTRPCPSARFLPALLDELARVGDQAITVILALGSHRRHTPQERERLVGREVLERVRVLDLDPEDCLSVGTTSRGTPVAAFRPFLEAELRVCTGNVEYHYFAGYSGGVKAAVPGLCPRATIQANHAMMLAPGARAGLLDGNPVREDIEEAGALLGIGFLFDVVLDGHKRIVRAFAGDPVAAFRAAAACYDGHFGMRVPRAVDVVVASPGGHPKDINLYQAQKTLDNVRAAVRKGGAIVLVAECPEGFGEVTFERWMREMSTPRALVERIQREFVLGGHKAAAVADLLRDVDVTLVSSFPDETVRAMGMTPIPRAQAAVEAAATRYGSAAAFLVVAEGGVRVTAEETRGHDQGRRTRETRAGHGPQGGAQG
jgi:nickel-dependent lactate racemase